MPICLKKNEYALTLTYKCNWKCSYCAVNNKYDYKDIVTHEDVLSKISKVPDKSIVTLFGGEPGLVDRSNIEQYIQILEEKKCKLWLETNGTFIQKYPDLVSRFEEVIWHCCEEINACNKIQKLQFDNVRYMVIVHNLNFSSLKQFLDLNNDIEFDIVEATYPYEEMKGPRLSKKNKNSIIAQFGSRMTKESFQRLLNGKDFDKITFLT